MSGFTSLIVKLNKNKFFRYVSSVKLAIPLMLTLCIVVAWGTVVESQYNSEYSSLLIYKSDWFGILLMLLWLNIFCATLSRWPFKKHHTGFVITHIGLLTLLIGGSVTNRYGIDGQLSIQENQSGRAVVLPQLMFGYTINEQSSIQKVSFPKMLSPQDKNDLASINEELSHLVSIEKYIPFAKVSRVYKADSTKSEEVALSFILKSQFFNVNEWLHTSNNPEMQMGPATLKIIKVDTLDFTEKTTKPLMPKKLSPKASHSKSTSKGKIIVLNVSNKEVPKEINITDLEKKDVVINNVTFHLKKRYRSAVVTSNQLTENSDPETSNPAVELEIKKDKNILREVLYAKFKDFSLNKEGNFGYHLQYIPDENDSENFAQEESSQATSPHTPDPNSIKPGSRVIEFRVSPKEPNKTLVVLYKDGKEVLKKKLSEGEKLTTPWMGMEIFLGSIQINAIESSDVSPINPEKRSELPPSAIQVNSGENQSFWLVEGEQKQVFINNRNITVYYGKEIIDLPFELNLQKFTKVDYPGTSTPMSFESLVQVNGKDETHKISMNEPLKQDGFTVYQASYILNPNESPVSVFSVNKDPGRVIKYIGSIILSLGIMIFTIMRSRFWKSLQLRK